jgi:DNA (cytosine-5)-methyltransferase 1
VAFHTLSLCAGVGGLDLGVRIARPDARCVAYVEREASAAAALVASMAAGRLHPAAVWSDLGTFDAGQWRGAVDCVLSGDPCQPNSVAGKRGGADDDRWLLDRVIAIFDKSGAGTLFRENVCGNIDGQLAVAIPALERLGCRIAVGIFSAGEAGASHRRERLFILAHRPSTGLSDRDGQRDRSARQCDAELERSNALLGSAGGIGPMAHTVGPVETRGQPASGQARGGRPHDQSGGSGRMVAHPDGGFAGDGQLQRGGQQRFQPQGAGAGRGDAVGNAIGGGHSGQPDDTRRRPVGRAAADGAGAGGIGPVGEPARDRRGEGQPESTGQQGRSDAVIANSTMADASSAGLQGGKFNGPCDDERNGPDAHGPATQLCAARFPPFAPGPSDPRWPAFIAAAPSLEPAVCRMADGLADRIERLRHGGNGVVPLAAALAWARLHALLDDDTAGDAVRFADDRSAAAGAAFVKEQST